MEALIDRRAADDLALLDAGALPTVGAVLSFLGPHNASSATRLHGLRQKRAPASRAQRPCRRNGAASQWSLVRSQSCPIQA